MTTYALVIVERARTPLAVHVLDVEREEISIPPGRDTAFVALLATHESREHMLWLQEYVRGCRTIAQTVERTSGSGMAVVMAERNGALCALTVLRSRGSPLPIAGSDAPTTVAVLATRPTQPLAAVELNRARDAGTQTIAAARTLLATPGQQAAA